MILTLRGRSNAFPACRSNANRTFAPGTPDHEPSAAAGCRSRDPVHAFAAMAAFALGMVQFAAPKGTLPHRTVGWIWVGLMAIVAVELVLDPRDPLARPWSPIHLLSIFTLIMLPIAVWRARRHRIADHRRIMTMIFCGRAGHCRAVHVRSGADHACGGFRPLSRRRKRRLDLQFAVLKMRAPCAPSRRCRCVKSMKKRAEKRPIRRASGWLSGPRYAI